VNARVLKPAPEGATPYDHCKVGRPDQAGQAPTRRLRGRFRWWGSYTQRKPGYDGTWTGDENTDMLEDEYFMLRVRCDGGALTAAALRTLGQISTEFARDTADISRPPERPVSLDSGREHAGDLEAARCRRPSDDGSVRGLPTC
jgi:hypothetical protein